MYRRIQIIITLLIFSLSISAQQKQLTLEDAVLRQYSKFYPGSLSGLQWIEDSQHLSWMSSDQQALLNLKAGENQIDTLLKTEGLNEALGLEMKSLRNPVWLSEHEFYFADQDRYYRYNTKKEKGSKWLDVPKGANRSFNKKSEAFAFTKDNNLYFKAKDKEAIAVTSFEDPNMVAGQAIARHEFGIGTGIFWSPKGKKIAFYQKDETDVSDYPILDISTTPGSLIEVKYPMAGQKSEYASVGVFNTKNGKTTYLKVEGPKEQYLTNLGWGPKGEYIYIAVLNRGQDHMQLMQFDAKSGDFVKILFEEKHDKYVEPEQPVHFVPGSKDKFLWFSERDGFNHLYLYDTAGKIINRVTQGNWEAQSIVGFDKKSKHVFVMGTDKTGLNRVLYKSKIDGSGSALLTKEEGMHYFELSSNGKYFTDNYSNLEIPGKISLFDADGMKLKDLFEGENTLEEYAIGEVEISDLKAEDGTILHTRMIKPYDFDPSKKYPVLVYVYGGPHAQMVTNRWLAGAPLWMYEFANRGYIVFTLDNRGSGNRGFEFENVIHRQLGELEIKDQLVGVDYLKSLDYVDGDRMAIHGWSYGGFMTTSLMLKTPGVFQVGVAGGPVTDWKYYEIMYGERYMDTPEENPEGYELTSLLNKADKLEGKLLLIHGTSDDVVVMQHNLSLVQACIKAGKQVDFFPYPMHKHNVRGKDRLHLIEKVLTYVAENLD